jgi:gamma-glutamyltranspeptidase/glutathione hydrolase
MPPPSSGGVVLLQALSVLEHWDLSGLSHNSTEHVHLLAETFQHGFADRANHMGDPSFTNVPIDRLLSPQRIQNIRDSFNPEQTLSTEQYGVTETMPDDAGTQHISVIDGLGGAVALTTTINTSFGSGVVAPMSGILLNNEMDDFVAAPGVPNAYGLIGREDNQVEAGKKPLSSMTPTILLKDGEIVMVVGGSGGPFIISSTLQVISNIVDFEMSPEQAVSASRMHHQWIPELLFLDQGLSSDLHEALQGLGHATQEMDFFSSVQVISNLSGVTSGAADPRKGGAAVEAAGSER